MKSTPEYPLAFFEYICNPNGFKEILENHLNYVFVHNMKFDLENSRVSGIEMIEQDEYEQTEYSLKEFLIPVLRSESRIAKENLYKFCIDQPNKAENYLNIQLNILEQIVNMKKSSVNDYPFLMLPLNGLVRYMTDILFPNENKTFKLELKNIDLKDKMDLDSKSVLRTDEEIIDSVIGYMSAYNEKRELILSPSDFELLISYTRELIINESNIGKIEYKLTPKITTGLLRFTFWVLHKEFYTTKSIRPYFIDFLKTVFNNFNEVEFESIRRSFKTTTYLKKESFIPEIIQDNF